jgi:hypothetical protein
VGIDGSRYCFYALLAALRLARKDDDIIVRAFGLMEQVGQASVEKNLSFYDSNLTLLNVEFFLVKKQFFQQKKGLERKNCFLLYIWGVCLLHSPMVDTSMCSAKPLPMAKLETTA